MSDDGSAQIDFEAELRKLDDPHSIEGTTLRMMWLRQTHPKYSVVVEPVQLTADHVIVRAIISLPGGVATSAIAMESGPAAQDRIELAEWNAIARALDRIGLLLPLDTQTASGSNTKSPPPVVDALRRASRAAPPTASEPTPPEVVFTVPTPFRKRSETAPESVEDDVQLEDFSWTAFWRWAREHGITRKAEIEQRIGREVGDLQPVELRLMLQESGIELD